MSPEQVRGEAVDARSDIFSFGAILYEMLTGRPAFARETAAETMTAVLKEEPAEPLPAGVAPALERIVSRCLEKTREMRFQSARDLAFGLEYLSGTSDTAAPAVAIATGRRSPLALGAVAVVVGLGALAAWSWSRRSAPPPSFDSLFAAAKFTPFTNFEGAELDAGISSDGNFVVFLADKEGPFHAFLSRVGTGRFDDLTPGPLDWRNPGLNRSVGFFGDGSEIWTAGTGSRRLQVRPIVGGGAPRAFLDANVVNLAWSHDGSRLVYFTFNKGDPMFVADGTGGNARQIFVDEKGDHNHFPAWSADGAWIYFARGSQPLSEFDVWRIPSSGGEPQRLTERNTDVRYVTPIDDRTVLFVAPDDDRTGPWLWALDVERKETHRVSTGLERYSSVSASGNGRRLAASVATSAASLWTLPILDRLADERDVKPYPVPTARALAPRFGGAVLFYLSSSGAGDGLWRTLDGQALEVWKGSEGALFEPPAVSPLGDRVAIVVKKARKLHLTLVSADGSNHRSLAEDIDVRGTSSWSPDGKWIVTGGNDGQGPGVFKIPAAGGAPVRLGSGVAFDPVWSPDGTVIVYAEEKGDAGQLLAVRPERGAEDPPSILVPFHPVPRYQRRAAAVRFLPSGRGLVYMQGPVGAQNFWLLDLATHTSRQIARLSHPATIVSFDVAPDGTHIVFDRVRENSDIRLIDLPK